MRRLRTVKPVLPSEVGTHGGLAYTLWLPDKPVPARGKPIPARGGIVILHGAGSCKESHHDFARAALPLGLAAISFDQRGHGESDGPMDGRALDDVCGDGRHAARRRSATRRPRSRCAARAWAATSRSWRPPRRRAAAVVAICPASGEGLRRGLRSGSFAFDADASALDPFLATHDLHPAVESLDVPLLLLHAEGDEQVPVEHSRELAALLRRTPPVA